MQDVTEARTLPVPKRLRDTHYYGSEKLGHGKASGETDTTYFGVEAKYYRPADSGYETDISKRLLEMERLRETAEEAPAELERELEGER